MSKKHVLLISTVFITMLSACSQHQQNLDNVDTSNITQLENVHTQPIISGSTSSSNLSQMRSKSLKDTAMSIGAQGGLAWASQQINNHINGERKDLDSIYNFNAMMLTHGVIPPVLEQGDYSLNLDDPNTIRVADRTYKIVKQARFATTPPNWRDYLIMNYDKPELPDKTLLPKTADEQKVWKSGIQSGWEKGIQQAYSIFQQNLAMLRRDYQGMILYRKLLQENMISAPFVARTELGITGNGSDMRVNDQVLRIVELPKLQTSGRNWRAVVVKN